MKKLINGMAKEDAMKKIFIAMVVIMLLLFTTSNARANDVVNAIVGIGVLAVILHEIPPYYYGPRYDYEYRQYNYNPRIAPRAIWIQPERIKVWTPGYYTQQGMWIRGGWRIVTERPGHYVYGVTDDYRLQFRHYR